MNARKLFVTTCLTGFVVAVGAIALAAEKKESKPEAAAAGGQPEFKLPPGWTEADMQACMIAGTPGEQHKFLSRGVGVWDGKNTMWMSPGAEPMTCEVTCTVTSLMDGRYVHSEMKGEMPQMGPYHGMGITGYDNVAGRYVSTWVDNHSTGIMNGTGKLSKDGKVMTWEFSYHCPVTKKPTVLREVETITGADTKTLEMFGKEPKSGKEYKMMRIELTRKPGGAPAARAEK